MAVPFCWMDIDAWRIAVSFVCRYRGMCRRVVQQAAASPGNRISRVAD
jgi:hypothetical protein